MGNYARGALGVFIAIAVIVGMLAGGILILFTPAEKLSVEANKSPGKDGGGYMWIDSLSPDPRVDFEWIECHGNPKSHYFPNVWNYYY